MTNKPSAAIRILPYLFLIALLMQLHGTAHAQTPLQDVVYLKNGSIIKGTIIEEVPNQSIKIQAADGSVFVYKMDEVEKITREEPPKKKEAPPATSNRKGLYFGIGIEPGCTYVYDKQNEAVGDKSDPQVKFMGEVLAGYWFTDHVGLVSGLSFAQYGVNYPNILVAYTTTYLNYPYAPYTQDYYGDARATITYLNVPVLLSCRGGTAGKASFILKVGPEVGFLLAAKEKITSSYINTTLDDASDFTSIQLHGYIMGGVHIPIGGEKLSLDVGPYVNIGILNLFNAVNAGDGEYVAREGAVGVAVHLLYTVMTIK